jgi:hypothetical protein
MINIVPGANPGDPAKFVPQLQQPGPNGEAHVSTGDLVNWFNGTTTAHQPEATDSTFNNPVNAPRGSGLYLSDEIAADKSSRPAWNAVAPSSTQKTVFYRCKLHHNEHGMIVVG